MRYSTLHYCCLTISDRILTFDELLIQKDTQIHYTNHILFIQGRLTYKFSYLCHILYLRSLKNNGMFICGMILLLQTLSCIFIMIIYITIVYEEFLDSVLLFSKTLRKMCDIRIEK